MAEGAIDLGKEFISLCCQDVFDDSVLEGLSSILTQSNSSLVDVPDKDGMTPLMHAAYKGRLKLCQFLLDNGANVNSDMQSEGYTPLMFATIAGHSQIVQLLLNRGAKVDMTNKVNRTASQMGGFVGQAECVQLINNFFSLENLQYYTKPQGLEVQPKLDPLLLSPLYEYITTTNVHPVNLLLILQSHDSLLIQSHSQVCNVLDIVCSKVLRQDNEGLSLKLHLLRYVIRQSIEAEDGTNTLMKNFLTQNEDGISLEMEKFLRQSLKSYPHAHQCMLLKQLVSAIAKVPLGGLPTTLSLFVLHLTGNRNFADHEVCFACGVSSETLKKCTKCKRALYCNVECQRLSWSVGNHRKLCKKWSKDTV